MRVSIFFRKACGASFGDNHVSTNRFAVLLCRRSVDQSLERTICPGGYISWLLQTGSSSYSSYFHTTTSTNDMVARLTISGTALSWTSITGSLGQRAGHVAVVLPDDSLIIHGALSLDVLPFAGFTVRYHAHGQPI